MSDDTTPQDAAAMSPASTGSLFSLQIRGLPIRVEHMLVGSKWAVVVKGRFIAVSPAMNDLICHASTEELQWLGEKILAVTVEPEWFEEYRLGWSGASFQA